MFSELPSNEIINRDGEWVDPTEEQIPDGDVLHEIRMGSRKKTRAVFGTAFGTRARQPLPMRRMQM